MVPLRKGEAENAGGKHGIASKKPPVVVTEAGTFHGL